MTDLAILACYAHPDDEQGITGTLRRCVEQGIRTAILCATRGEVGEIADPALATPETLGAVREDELRRAAAIIGVQDVFLLDYRDSGMIGTPENADKRNFINADEDETVGQIVKVIRTFKPTILVTFDETGGYGHPDHLAINRRTMVAFHAAADPTRYPEAGAPFKVSRLFYASFGRSMINQMRDYFKQQGLPAFFEDVDPNKMGMPDEAITNRVDVTTYVDLKRRSVLEHRTQMNPNSPMMKVPDEVWTQWRATESFALVAGVPFPPGADQSDLFAGLR